MELSRFRPNEDSLMNCDVANNYVVKPLNTIFGLKVVDDWGIFKFEEAQATLDLSPLIDAIAVTIGTANDGAGEGILNGVDHDEDDGTVTVHAKSLKEGDGISITSDEKSITIQTTGPNVNIVSGDEYISVTSAVAGGVTTFTIKLANNLDCSGT